MKIIERVAKQLEAALDEIDQDRKRIKTALDALDTKSSVAKPRRRRRNMGKKPGPKPKPAKIEEPRAPAAPPLSLEEDGRDPESQDPPP